MNEYDFMAGDTGSILRVTLKDRQTNNPIGLISARVGIVIRRRASRIDHAMTIEDANRGVVSYQFLTDDLKPGVMNCWISILDQTGNTLTSLSPLSFAVGPAQP